MRRRKFIAFLASATAIWPELAFSQSREPVRRVGVFLPLSGNEAFWRAYLAAFKERLRELGWVEGKNIRYEERLVGESTTQLRGAVADLIASTPDVIFVTSNAATAIVTRATRTIPVVFASVSDSVGSGFVTNLARPGRNVTGFHNYEVSFVGKWMEVLKELSPGVRRVCILHDPEIAANVAFLRAAESLSGPIGVKVVPGRVHEGIELESVITEFAKEPGGGLVVIPNPINQIVSDKLIMLTERLKLPAIYPFSNFAASGGLASYGIDRMQQVREAASYVDRILRGADAGDLPVQLPTKYELVINLKTAKALGLNIPQAVLSRADQVIQ
jgi:putative ABC transport system substrate-binding protein